VDSYQSRIPLAAELNNLRHKSVCFPAFAACLGGWPT